MAGDCIMVTKVVVQHLRKQIEKPQFGEIVVQNPPQELKPESFGWIASLMQCVVPIVSFLVIAWISNDIDVALVAAIISALGTFVTSLISHYLKKRKIKRQNKENEEKYRHYLIEIEGTIQEHLTKIIDFNKSCYPDLMHSKSILCNKTEQLWDRQLFQKDFLYVNIGKCISKGLTIKLPEYKAGSKYASVFNKIEKLVQIEQPILIDIKKGPVAFWGTEKFIKYAVMNLFADICCHHSYIDVQIVLLGDSEHFEFPNRSSYCYADEMNLIGHSQVENVKIKKWLLEILAKRDNSIIKDKSSKLAFPYYLLIADVTVLTEQEKNIFSDYSQRSIGFSAVFLTDHIEYLPKYVNHIIKYSGNSLEVHDGTSDPQIGTYQSIHQDWAELMKIIEQIHAVTEVETVNIPLSITLYEGFGVNSVKELDVRHRWLDSVKSGTLKTPIGIQKNGELFELDITDHADGPHGLIAGMTGSGKSELINTLVLSLAINYPPSKIGFYLVDFKGGYLGDKFRELPHVRGKASNVDNNMSQMLEDLKAELHNRQKMFCETGCNNIDQYTLKTGMFLPHLLLIVDEFAELKYEHPEFMNIIMRIARVGRAFGIHLLLASQLVTGIIDEQIHANIRYRFCFRLPNEHESYEVINSPKAISIRRTGRACFAVHGERFEEVQVFFSEAYDRNNAIYMHQSDSVIKYIRSEYDNRDPQ